MRCYCCSDKKFSQCCQPFVDGLALPNTAEQLMRSRFTAYAIRRYDYVLNTYSEEKQNTLSVTQLEESAAGAVWFALSVVPSQPASHSNQCDSVEFTAYYFEGKSLFQLHETSHFIIEGGTWRYHDGELADDCGKLKYGRNLPCLCNSGKKFKQCCATKMR